MKSIATLVGPDEIGVLKAYITKLRDGSLSDKDKKDPSVSFHPLDVAKRIIAFYIDRKEKGISVSLGGRYVNVEYLSDMVKNDRTLLFLLNESDTYIEEMLDDYHRLLVSNPRHYVLSKTIDKLTGYDLQKIISYTIEDTKDMK